MLLDLAVEHEGRDWLKVSQELGTGRRPIQCFRHYQQALNKGLVKKGVWTKEEDEALRSAVERAGVEKKNWTWIARALPGRAPGQCQGRWSKSLDPALQWGPWTAEEERLGGAGSRVVKWEWVAKFVPGRTDAQCREKWVNVLDPRVNRSAWSPAEDARLQQGCGATRKQHRIRATHPDHCNPFHPCPHLDPLKTKAVLCPASLHRRSAEHGSVLYIVQRHKMTHSLCTS
ncbi:unnamed protein product [Discosporangium mesarthrocarpum]